MFRSSGPGRDGIPDYLKIEGSKAAGVEFEVRLQRALHGVTASAFYTLADSEVTTTVSTSEQFQPGQPLLRRPKHSGNVFASWQRGPAGLNGGVQFVGARHDFSFLSMTTAMPVGGRVRTVDIRCHPLVFRGDDHRRLAGASVPDGAVAWRPARCSPCSRRSGFLAQPAAQTAELLLDVKLIGHRGFTLDAMENSMAALEAAARLSIAGSENDLRTTCDGAVVLMHDPSVDRTTKRDRRD